MTRSEEIRQRLEQIDAQIKRAKVPEAMTELPAVKASDSEGIKNLQEKLRSLGYYQGAVDGKWATQTQAAVQQYNQAKQARDTQIGEAQAGVKPLIDEQARLSQELSQVSRQEANNTPGEVTKRIAIQAVPALAGTGWAFKSAPGIEQRLQAKDAVRTASANALAADIDAVDPKSPLAREQYNALAKTARQGGYLKTGRGVNSLVPSALPILAGAAGRFALAPAFYAQGQDTAGDITTAIGAGQLGLGGTQLFLGAANNALAPQVIPDSAVAKFRMAEAAARAKRDGPALAAATPTPSFDKAAPIDATPSPELNAYTAPAPSQVSVPQDPHFQQYLAQREAELRAQIATGRGQPPLMLQPPQQTTPQLHPQDTASAPPTAAPEEDISSLQRQLQEALSRPQPSQSELAQIEALKQRIQELQGTLDAQAQRRAASFEKGGITRALNAGNARLDAAPSADVIERARSIDPESNWLGAKDVVRGENERFARLSRASLEAEAKAVGIATEGLSRGRLITALMRAKTFGVPAAVAIGGTALLSNDARAGRRTDESTPAYVGRTLGNAALNAAPYLVPGIGEALIGSELGSAVREGMADPGQSVMPPGPMGLMRARLAAEPGRALDEARAADVAEGLYMAPAGPRDAESMGPAGLNEAIQSRANENLSQALLDDLRQRQELRYRQNGPEASAVPDDKSQGRILFEKALEELAAAFQAHHAAVAEAQPRNALMRGR
jgi:hypothetical protein